MKLIDKSALVAEIKNRIKELQNLHKENEEKLDSIQKTAILLCIDECKVILSLINTLEVKEVDLEHEVESYWKQCDMTWCRDAYSMTHIRSMLSDIAKHFFELGISVSNSTKVTTPDVDDVLKENGVNPDSKEAKIIKESYFMAIEKLAQKGEEV